MHPKRARRLSLMAEGQMGWWDNDGCSIRIWLKVAGFHFNFLRICPSLQEHVKADLDG